MQGSLSLLPNGHIHLSTSAVDEEPKLAKALNTSQAEGLVYLATKKPIHESTANWPLEFLFWRNFALRYFKQLCHTHTETASQLEKLITPTDAECDQLILQLPPMPGAEYCNQQTFATRWSELNTWTEATLTQLGTMGALLNKYLPQWTQIGRVSFHLAENKNNSDYPFAFMATYASSMNKDDKIQYQPLSKALAEFAGSENKKALLNLLKPVYEASKYCPWVKTLIDKNDIYYPLAWSPQEAYQLLQSVPELEKSGLLVRLPDWWKKKPRAQVQVTIGDSKKSAFGANALLDFKLSVALEGVDLSEEELKTLLASENGLMSFRGRWIEVDAEKLEQALSHWQSVKANVAEGGISFAEGMRLLAGANADLSAKQEFDDINTSWAYVNAGGWLKDILEGLRSPDSITFQQPKNLQATLRPYQQTGVSWLHFLNELGLGACLADDMGLGKTIQIIALLLLKQQQQKNKQPSLLVLPASLIGNWKSELSKFSPSLKPLIIHSSELSRSQIEKLASNSQNLHKFDIVITTYATLARQDWLREFIWDSIILDEAQAIKNPGAKQTKIIKTLKGRARIALTGTPVENRLGDLWSLFDFLSPGLLGNVSRFKSFVKSLGKNPDNDEEADYAPLRKLVQPYILRRLKTDKTIINDLPDKTEVTTWCGLSKLQAKLYSQAVRDLQTALDKAIEEQAAGIKRRGLVLAFLTRFKQICNHPSQALANGEYDAKSSGKFERLGEICEEIASRQEKVLIFTQYREMTKPISDFLAGVFNQSGLVLHGGTPVKQRKKLVDQFQSESGPPYFVLSLKAGGTGLNLTAASHIIHFDRWWNPAVENQATDRAFRIGQKRNVLVHKFVCRGTIEEKVDQMIAEKSALADNLLSNGGESSMLTEMNDQALLNLVSLDIDQAVF